MKTPLLIICSMTLAGAASAQVVTLDNFSIAGALTANGWTAHSGAGNKVIMSDGNVATLEFGSGSGEDVNLSFAPFSATATIYAAFTLNVPSGNPVNPDANGSYFAHVKAANNTFRARTGLLSPASAGDYGLGIHASGSSIGAGALWPADLLFDTDYEVVISYDAATGESKLWVDATLITDPSVSHTGTSGTIIEQFALRQSGDHNGFITVDNVVVGGSFGDVTVVDPANQFLRSDSQVGCTGRPLHFTSSMVPADPTAAASWANGTTAAMTVINMDPALNIGVLVFGSATINLPIFGGVLIPSPDVVQVVVGAAGSATVSVTIPPGLTGAAFLTQFAIFDTCVPTSDLVFSNGQLHILP